MCKFKWYRITCLCLLVLPIKGFAKDTVGWLERATINTVHMTLVAKLDTGAKTASLGYSSLHFFQRDGQRWVRVGVTNKKDKTVVLEKKVIRTVTIKQHLGEAPHKRPVIMLGICLKHTFKNIEVDLMDRKGFNYILLLGRNYLAGDFVVDASAKFTQEPDCKPGSGQQSQVNQ